MHSENITVLEKSIKLYYKTSPSSLCCLCIEVAGVHTELHTKYPAIFVLHDLLRLWLLSGMTIAGVLRNCVCVIVHHVNTHLTAHSIFGSRELCVSTGND